MENNPLIKEMWNEIIPKVLVGTVTYKGKAYCEEEFMERALSLTYGNYSHYIVHTDDFEGNSRDRITEGYQRIFKYFLEGDYDYLLTLESDVIPPKYIIEALMEECKDIIGALYMVGKKNNRYPCAFTGKKTRIKHPNGGQSTGIESITLQDIDGTIKPALGGIGLGCCLIKRDIIKEIPLRWGEAHCDMYFHEDAVKKGYIPHIHTGIICKHYGTWEEWQPTIAKQDF